MAQSSYSIVHLEGQKNATAALIKFCEEHEYETPSVQTLRSCLAALKQGDIESALNYYSKVPLGGMGCFNDWQPPVVFSNETPEYVQTVFDALVANWSLTMRLSLTKN